MSRKGVNVICHALVCLLCQFSSIYVGSIHAAKRIYFYTKPILELSPTFLNGPHTSWQMIRYDIDGVGQMHTRMRQIYHGVPVFGGELILHTPSRASSSATKLSGIYFSGIHEDLADPPKNLFSTHHQAYALQSLMHHVAWRDAERQEIQLVEPIVFVDEGVAHWAYKIIVNVVRRGRDHIPHRYIAILDADNYQSYLAWDDIKTTYANGGGYGGNEKVGRFIYDGGDNNLSSFTILRDVIKRQCSLRNSDVIVKSENTNQDIAYDCENVRPEHNHVFWNDDGKMTNGGYSPANDAMFGAESTVQMYRSCCDISIRHQINKPLVMMINADIDNAYWDTIQVVLGDGVEKFYPMTSLDVIAHEISHGVTEHYSNLLYLGQSGGINESFSDMAAQAAQVFMYGEGTNNWRIADSVMKEKSKALRYMMQPSMDCGMRDPGDWCSIDHVTQFKKSLDVHFLSGIYNRFFYLLSQSQGWDVMKAFRVMVHANQYYWASLSDYQSAACGVVQAANDFSYDAVSVKHAFYEVGISHICE